MTAPRPMGASASVVRWMLWRVLTRGNPAYETALALALALTGCTATQTLTSLAAVGGAAALTGSGAEVAGEAWGAPLARAGEWLLAYASKRLDKRGELRAAAEALALALEVERAHAQAEALASVDADVRARVAEARAEVVRAHALCVSIEAGIVASGEGSVER